MVFRKTNMTCERLLAMAGAPNNSETTQYPDLVIVGAGLFGLTVAQQAVEHTGKGACGQP